MNPILLSFLCGAAFIGGACVTSALVFITWSLRNNPARTELMNYWKESIRLHGEQIQAVQRIAICLEKLETPETQRQKQAYEVK